VFVGLFGGLLGVCGVLGVWWLYGCCLRRPRSDPWTIGRGTAPTGRGVRVVLCVFVSICEFCLCRLYGRLL